MSAPGVPIPYAPRAVRDRNGRTGPAEERCLICNKGLRNPAAAAWQEIATDGTLIPAGDARSEGPESQGYFAVGPECIRKIARALGMAR